MTLLVRLGEREGEHELSVPAEQRILPSEMDHLLVEMMIGMQSNLVESTCSTLT